jgi:hypothetical protein
MWFSSDHRGVRIFVRGEFIAPRQWLIYATVASGPGIDAAMGAASHGRTLGELWQAIALERRVGRRLGALAIRVVVDGDRDIAGLFATSEKPDGSPAPDPSCGSRNEGPSAVIARTGRVSPSTLLSVPVAPSATTNMHSG